MRYHTAGITEYMLYAIFHQKFNNIIRYFYSFMILHAVQYSLSAYPAAAVPPEARTAFLLSAGSPFYRIASRIISAI